MLTSSMAISGLSPLASSIAWEPFAAFTHPFEFAVPLQQAPETTAYEWVIVGNENADRHEITSMLAAG